MPFQTFSSFFLQKNTKVDILKNFSTALVNEAQYNTVTKWLLLYGEREKNKQTGIFKKIFCVPQKK